MSQNDDPLEVTKFPEEKVVDDKPNENSQISASSLVHVSSQKEVPNSSDNALHVLATKVLFKEDDEVIDDVKSACSDDAFDPNNWSVSGSILKDTMQNVCEDTKPYFSTQVAGKLLVLEQEKEGSSGLWDQNHSLVGKRLGSKEGARCLRSIEEALRDFGHPKSKPLNSLL